MIDLKLVQKQPEVLAKALADRQSPLKVDEFLELDGRRRALLAEVESLKQQQNAASRQVAQIKREGGDASHMMEEPGALSARIKALDVQTAEAKAAVENWLMGVPNIFVWTHDSIGLGEDGPTHQPVEHLTAMRAIPNLDVVRPADGNETAVAWRKILDIKDHPAGLVLSRQNLTNVAREDLHADAEGEKFASANGAARGGYVLADTEGTPDVIIIATGSEVEVALVARTQLAEEGIAARVVSMPCREWFAAESAEYRESVIPSAVKARVTVEAGLAMPWMDILGEAGRAVSLEHYGASASAEELFADYGFTAENVAAKARESIAAAR